jgi:hypothetical protein
MDVKKKHEIEAALAQESQQISTGQLKEENPLDLSDNFRKFCEACRRNDLKVCQEMISAGVNINARDKFDYTPLILVSSLRDVIPSPLCDTLSPLEVYGSNSCMTRLVYAGTMKLSNCCLRTELCASGIPSKANGVSTMPSTTVSGTSSSHTIMRSPQVCYSLSRPI